MLTPHEIVGVALDQLTDHLGPYVERELGEIYGPDWMTSVRIGPRSEFSSGLVDEWLWDSQAILVVMWDHWNQVFRRNLGLFERSLVSELREFRNRWAHQGLLTEDDAYRVIDSVQRLIQATHAAEGPLSGLDELKLDILRAKLARQVNADQMRVRYNRERLTEVILYLIAATAVVLTSLLAVVPKNRLAGSILCLFTGLVFGYIILKRWRVSTPIHGLHECPRCRKVIYSEICPYCEAPPLRATNRGSWRPEATQLSPVAHAGQE